MINIKQGNKKIKVLSGKEKEKKIKENKRKRVNKIKNN